MPLGVGWQTPAGNIGAWCYPDNIFIERLWRSLKQYAVRLCELQDRFQAKRVIDEWLGFYTALDKRTPDDAYFEPRLMNEAARNLSLDAC